MLVQNLNKRLCALNHAGQNTGVSICFQDRAFVYSHRHLANDVLYRKARVENVPPLLPQSAICRQDVQLAG
jgi:hypothetical protein